MVGNIILTMFCLVEIHKSESRLMKVDWASVENNRISLTGVRWLWKRSKLMELRHTIEI